MDDSLVMAAKAVGFLTVLWLAGYLFRRMQLSSLVGEIMVGIALGPGGLDVIPESEGFALLGKLGVFWLMFDGGAHFSLSSLQGSGMRAFLVAITGLVVPLCIVWGVMALAGFTMLQSFVMGTALAPTSAGMTVKLMGDAGVLQSKMGQMIVCAAMTDDVFSLIILAIVSNLGGAGDLTVSTAFALDIVLPLVTSAGFIVLVGGTTMVLPKLLSGCSVNLLAPLMVAWSTALALACNFGRSSEYMGVFLAGACFTGVRVLSPRPEDVSKEESDGSDNSDTSMEMVPIWLERESTQILESFLVSIFFASAGFFVQVKVLLEPSTLALGFLCAFVALIGKLLAGVWYPGSRLCVGMAMASRGELGLVMASQSYKLGITPASAFSITVWGVLLNTLIAPPLFQLLLQRAARDSSSKDAPDLEHSGHDATMPEAPDTQI